MLVTKEFSFSGAHNLVGYQGKCEKLHGHTWKVLVTVDSPVGENGLAFDFVTLKQIVIDKAIETLDHSYVNDIIKNPSAENISIWIWAQLKDEIPLHEIKVYESPTSYVTYRGE